MSFTVHYVNTTAAKISRPTRSSTIETAYRDRPCSVINSVGVWAVRCHSRILVREDRSLIADGTSFSFSSITKVAVITRSYRLRGQCLYNIFAKEASVIYGPLRLQQELHVRHQLDSIRGRTVLLFFRPLTSLHETLKALGSVPVFFRS